MSIFSFIQVLLLSFNLGIQAECLYNGKNTNPWSILLVVACLVFTLELDKRFLIKNRRGFKNDK